MIHVLAPGTGLAAKTFADWCGRPSLSWSLGSQGVEACNIIAVSSRQKTRSRDAIHIGVQICVIQRTVSGMRRRYDEVRLEDTSNSRASAWGLGIRNHGSAAGNAG